MLFRLLTICAAAILLCLSAFAAAAASSSLEDMRPTSTMVTSSLATAVSPKASNTTAFDLAQIAAAEGFMVNDKISVKWKGIATIEVYMGSRVMTNVGYIIGPMMYNMVQQTLRVDCQDTIGGRTTHECWSKWHPFETKYRKDDGGVEYTLLQVHVKTSYYKNMQVRNLLIGAVAAAYEESTKLARNCYYANDSEVGYRYCNTPHQVGAATEDSHILMEITSDIVDDNDGSYYCCETRERVDKRLDELMGEFKSVYPSPRSKERNVDCYMSCGGYDRESNTHVDMILIDLMESGL